MWNGEYSIPMLIEEGSDWEIKPVVQTDINEDNSVIDSDKRATTLLKIGMELKKNKLVKKISCTTN